MILLSEWNDSAVAILLLIFFILVTLVFLLLRMVLLIIPKTQKWRVECKEQKPVVYYLRLLLVYVIAALVTVGIGNIL